MNNYLLVSFFTDNIFSCLYSHYISSLRFDCIIHSWKLLVIKHVEQEKFSLYLDEPEPVVYNLLRHYSPV